jgi:hypothetical protein
LPTPLRRTLFASPEGAMQTEKPIRRMTLRQLLTHSEKSARDLAEYVHTQFLTSVSDFRDLSRPVRRRSHYPTMVAMQNALRKLNAANDKMTNMLESLNENLDAIRDHANREKVHRR